MGGTANVLNTFLSKASIVRLCTEILHLKKERQFNVNLRIAFQQYLLFKRRKLTIVLHSGNTP